MRFLTLIALALTLTTPSRNASASESVADVARAAAQKKALVSYLQKSIARHGSMTREQILAEFAQTANANAFKQDPAIRADFEKAATRTLDHLKSAESAEELIALEKAELLQAQSAENYVWARWSYRDAQVDSYAELILVSLVIVPLDIILLPYDLVRSIITGF